MIRFPGRFLYFLPLLIFSLAGSNVAAQRNQFNGSFPSLGLTLDASAMGRGDALVAADPSQLLAVAYQPALAIDSLSENAALSFGFLRNGWRYASSTYAHSFGKVAGNASASRQIVFNLRSTGFGQITSRDPAGNDIGTVSVNESSVSASHGWRFGNFLIGAGLQFNQSTFANQNAFAIGLKWGVVYRHSNKLFQAAVAMNQLGFLLKDYNASADTQIPIDIRIGFSYILRHAPFKLNVQWSGLGIKDYDDLAVGLSLLPRKKVSLNVGYRLAIAQGLSLDENSGGTGFTFGASVKTKTINVHYAKLFYSSAGSTNQISISKAIRFYD